MIDGHYEYSIHGEGACYFVTCKDTQSYQGKPLNVLQHPTAPYTKRVGGKGHFTVDEAHAFVDERIERSESLRR